MNYVKRWVYSHFRILNLFYRASRAITAILSVRLDQNGLTFYHYFLQHMLAPSFPSIKHLCEILTRSPHEGAQYRGLVVSRPVYSDTTQLNSTRRRVVDTFTAWTTVDSVCRSWRHQQKHDWLGCTLFNWVSWVELSWVQFSWVVSL